jgi:hypothetical protein
LHNAPTDRRNRGQTHPSSSRTDDLLLISPSHPLKTRNVVLIVSDGLRWQEIFTAADPTLMDRDHGGIWADPKELKQKFWGDDVEERRRLLFPMFRWRRLHCPMFGDGALPRGRAP